MTMNSFIELINNRRSIRAFTGKFLTEDQLKEIVTCGMHAPSAHNKQPWVFLSITNREKMMQIAPLCSWWGMLENAGAVIITCMNKDLLGDIQKEFFVNSCSAATENMLLAAKALGLGGVWLGVVEESALYDDFCRVIKLPDNLQVMSMIAVGTPVEEVPFIERFDPEKWIQEEF